MTHQSSQASSIQIDTDLNVVSVHEFVDHTQDVFNLIARRAFEIFEARGRGHGNDREDWHLAESELLTPVKFHLSESGEHVTARADVAGFNSQEVKVSLEPRRLSISGKAAPREDHHSGKHTHSPRHEQLMFGVIELPCEVDLSKAKATFNDGALEVVMPKTAPAKSIRVETTPGLSAEGEPSVIGTDGIETADTPPLVPGADEPIAKGQAASSRR